jgi:hypothetical protein
MHAVDARLGDEDRGPDAFEPGGGAEGAMEIGIEAVEGVNVALRQSGGLALQDCAGFRGEPRRPCLRRAAQHREFQRLADEMIVAHRAKLDGRNETAFLRKHLDKPVLDEADDGAAHRRARHADLAADAVLAD